MNFTVRPAERRDIDALASLWKAFLDEQATLDPWFRPAEDVLERWRNDFPLLIRHERRKMLVAEEANKLVGFALASRWAPPALYELVPEIFIEELYVAPDARRKGVGARLVEEVRAWAESLGARALRLGVLSENEAGQAFWKLQGGRSFSQTYLVDLPATTALPKEEKRGKLGF